jgi:hypothetical protein
MAAGHGAGRHATHVVAAIRGPIRGSGRLLVVMLGDRAVVSGTTSHTTSGPSSSSKGSVQQYNRQQTETSGDNWPAIWNPGAQGVRLHDPILRQNIPLCMNFAELSGARYAKRGQYWVLAYYDGGVLP